MYRHWLFPLIVALAGCPAAPEPTDGMTDGTTDETDKKTVDTELPDLELTGASAHVVLGQNYSDVNEGGIRYANAYVFDTPANQLNLPGCVFRDHICTDVYPAEGKFHEPNVLPLTVAGETIDAGKDFTVASTILTSAGGGQVVAYYQGTPSTLNGPANLIVDGDLAAFSGDDLFDIAEPLAITTPKSADERYRVESGETFDLAWNTGGNGSIYLEVGSRLNLQVQAAHLPRNMRIYGLADSGTYSFDPSALDLLEPVDTLTVNLARITNTPVDAGGNTFNVQTRVEQTYVVDVVTAGKDWMNLRDGSFIASTCSEAKGLGAVTPGQYWGDLSAYDNDVEVQFGNTNAGTTARDGFVKVILDEGDEIRLQSDQPETFAALHVFDESCGSTPLESGFKGTAANTIDDPIDFIFEAPADGAYYIAVDGDLGGNLFSLSITEL